MTAKPNNIILKLGPGAGGALFHPIVSPHGARTMLAACDMSGAYVTHDGGESWRQFNLKCGVGAFAFDPAEPDTIYAGSTGFFRSADGGRRWSMLFPAPEAVTEEKNLDDESDTEFVTRDNWPGGRVAAIGVDALDNRRIAIAVHKYGGGDSLFVTRDKGFTWERACAETFGRIMKLRLRGGELLVFEENGVHAVDINSRACERLPLPRGVSGLAGAACGSADGRDIYYIIGKSGPCRNAAAVLFRSFDPFKGWERAGEIPEAGPEWLELSGNPMPEAVAACGNAGGCLYLSVAYGGEGAGSPYDPSYFFGILKSRDFGASWQWALKGSRYADPLNREGGWVEQNYGPEWHYIGPKGERPLGLAAAPGDPDVCLCTDLGAASLTADGGISWRQVYCDMRPDGSASSRGLDVTTCYGVHFDPFDRGHIAVSYTDCGAFHSDNGGESWKHALAGLPPEWGNTCYWLEFDPDVRGRAWSAWAMSHDLPRAKMFRSGGLNRTQGGVCRTDSGMLHWRKSSAGMHENSIVTHILLDPSSPAGRRTLYAAAFGRGVYKSTDDGYHWEPKNGGIAGNRNAWRLWRTPEGALWLVIARGARDGREEAGALYVSHDGAESWRPMPLPEDVNAPNDLSSGPDGTLYLACWPRFRGAQAYGGGLCESRDGGASWKNIFDGKAHAYCAIVHPARPQTLFLTTFGRGVHRSDDGGKTWRRLPGYDFKAWHRAIVDPYDPESLYLTSFGSSVWHGPIDGSPEDESITSAGK